MLSGCCRYQSDCAEMSLTYCLRRIVLARSRIVGGSDTALYFNTDIHANCSGALQPLRTALFGWIKGDRSELIRAISGLDSSLCKARYPLKI